MLATLGNIVLSILILVPILAIAFTIASKGESTPLGTAGYGLWGATILTIIIGSLATVIHYYKNEERMHTLRAATPNWRKSRT